MSKLLINESPLVFVPSLAVKIGLGEAIVVQQIHYWLQRTKPMEDGFCWVYNSVEEWGKQFPFWHRNTIANHLKSLRDDGILIAEYKAKSLTDRTLYYRINYDKLSDPITQNLWNPIHKNCNITINTETTREYIARFDIFWSKYPKKVSKPSALKAWKKIKPNQDLLEKMLLAIDKQGLKSRDIQFVPNPSTWLNNDRWEDELQSTQQATEDWRWRLVK